MCFSQLMYSLLVILVPLNMCHLLMQTQLSSLHVQFVLVCFFYFLFFNNYGTLFFSCPQLQFVRLNGLKPFRVGITIINIVETWFAKENWNFIHKMPSLIFVLFLRKMLNFNIIRSFSSLRKDALWNITASLFLTCLLVQ